MRSVPERFINYDADLPYDVEVDDVVTAINQTYEYYDKLNEWHVKNNFGTFEDALRGNSATSDFLGNVVTGRLGKVADPLTHNQREDGFPDLIPTDAYSSYRVQNGDYGIETKCSGENTGWQAHSNRDIWVMVFRYDIDKTNGHFVFNQVSAAKLGQGDWSHSPSKGDSRRTQTSTIVKSGMDKLRSNPIVQRPNAITYKYAEDGEKYREIQENFDDEYDNE